MISSNILRIEPENRVGLSVKGLTVSVKSQSTKDVEKGINEHTSKILNNVSFDLNGGEMLAIMGGSGSGKTTLLNTLSQRLNINNKKLSFDGSIDFIRRDNSKKVKNAYLLQTDVFLPGLSVFETLKYQADLRLPPRVTEDDKKELIGSLLETLELAPLKNKVISSFSTKLTSLSGGEQRRVSLAIQLLSKPSILFLDEPTTGLDTSTSLKLIRVLKKLASPELGITIVLSIHQPRPEISLLFDQICLLTRGGRAVYYGNLVDSYSYFNSLEFIQDAYKHGKSSNFIDYIMNLSVKDVSTKANEVITNNRVNKLVECWSDHCQSNAVINLTPKEIQNKFENNVKLSSRSRKDRISFFRELTILTRRVFILTYYDKSSLLALNGLSLFLAIASGWMFYKPDPDLAGIRSITSSLYVMLEIIGFCSMFIEIERLWYIDGICFFREYQENYVSIPGFILSRRLGKLLLEDLPVPIIFGVITYFMWGLRLSDEADGPNNMSYFFIYLAITILTNFIGISTALFIFAVSPDFSMSSLIVNVFYQLQNSACGYFVNAATMPVYVRWTKYIAYFWYAFGALTANQFSDWMGNCPYDHDSDKCIEYSGNNQLEVLGFPIHWIGEPIGILIAWYIGFNILTAIALYFKKLDMSIAKTKRNKIGEEEEEEMEGYDEGEENRNDSKESKVVDESKAIVCVKSSSSISSLSKDIEVNLHNINLTVIQKNWYYKVINEKQLLQEVSAIFQANKVNAIMGPSGSGKTTLLNYLSDRLSRTSNYGSNGFIMLNGSQMISPNDMSKISGYVSQNDHSLIPNLTVRETLYYQAKLRLPIEDHERIPYIINSLIRKIGLNDCADTLIGSEFVKGISGGEKRRVSIAIQLLSKPKILFLDEPTSGLDSSTAGAILSLLNKLAREDKATVILTIHQPNEDIFNSFGSLLLLARGGKVIYNGNASEITEYLNSTKYNVPNNINIADYILDLVSQGLDERIEIAQSRIDDLIYEWKTRHLKSEFNLVSDEKINLLNYHSHKLPVLTTFATIARRQMLYSIRSREILISRAGQTIFLAIVHTLFFAPLRNTEEGISNRLGLIQEVLNLYFVGLVNNITLYPVERNLFYQEYRDGIYGVIEFSASYLINELPTEIIPCLFFSCLLVFVCGLPRTPGMFFSMFFTGFVSINCGESLGILVNSIFNHLGLATNILTSLVILAVFMGGTMSLHMPSFFKAINFINPMKYAVGICAKLGFQSQEFDCGSDNCILSTGDKVLDYYNLDNNLGAFFGGLIACLVMYRLVAVGSLYLRVKYYN